MKIIYIFVISILLFSCSSTQSTTNDLNRLELNGKVERVISKKRSNNDTINVVNTIVVFNKKGNMLTEDFFKTDTVSISKLSTKTVYFYTKFGKKKIKEQYKSNGRLYRKETYKYNSNKKLIQKSRFDGKGKPLFVWEYKYNNEGKKIENIVKDVSYGSHTLDKSVFRYDRTGNRIETKNYDNNGELNSLYSYQFKKNYLVKAEFTFFTKGIKTTRIDIYDKKGNAIKSEYYDKNNQLTTTFNTLYDNKNNKIETIYIKNKLEEKTTFKYKYDLHNNWIYKEERINDKLKVTIREIEYYIK